MVIGIDDEELPILYCQKRIRQPYVVHVLYGHPLQVKPGRTFGDDDCGIEDGHDIQPRLARPWDSADKHTGPVPT